ncbi:uncharacterized protein LOC129606644 [Condylostylus longicornis]|uniref:uncharacterized protein LOC129606644 n=1 Tax=Condylostylus longicornis TaxID=2530218 RepID=UPI00244DAC9D|nr:uncharacterized protein LOC129606644 [Condylostylus longicornis]
MSFSKPSNQDEPEYMHDEDYDEEEEQAPPENKSTENIATDTVTQPPYFPSPHEKYHIKLGSDAELKCSAKQLTATNVILWYKDTNVISNGKQLTSGEGHFKILSDYSLLIQNATHEDGGNYYCVVLPNDIKLHVEVQIDEEETSPEEQQAPPAEHNQASQIGQQAVTETNPSENGCNGKISQSIILTLITITLTSVLRI